MAINLELTPKTKRPPGEPCCEPVVYPDVERDQAMRMATIAKAGSSSNGLRRGERIRSAWALDPPAGAGVWSLDLH